MSERRNATMADAKAAWDAHPNPSLRGVVKAMKEAGLSITISTLQRWCKAGFAAKVKAPPKPSRRVTPKQRKPAAVAASAKEAAVDVANATKEMEGKALTRLEVIEREEQAMADERVKLLDDKINLSQLAETAKRECLIASIVLARQITRRAPVLVEVCPDIAAKALDVLVEATRTTTIVIPDPPANEPSGNGDGARVVDGTVIAKSETAIALESFKNRRRAGVAA